MDNQRLLGDVIPPSDLYIKPSVCDYFCTHRIRCERDLAGRCSFFVTHQHSSLAALGHTVLTVLHPFDRVFLRRKKGL